MKINKLIVEASTKSFNNLPHITEVEPIGECDVPLLKDIRAVLEKHNALNRFGLQLLHKHFDLKENEILREETDEVERISSISPIESNKLSNAFDNASITYTTVFFTSSQVEHPNGVVTLACAISCASHGFGKVHRTG